MKKLFSLMIVVLAFSFSAFAQDNMTKSTEVKKSEKAEAKPTDKDKTEAIPSKGFLVRGTALSDKTEKVSLADVMADPAKYADKTVRVEGVIVRSCKAEGCWMELAPSKEARSVRVKMKDHAFFIPLDSAGAIAKAEGVFSVKTLSKDQVEHMIKDDGAKFSNINPDGTVTEISFEATGVELSRAGK